MSIKSKLIAGVLATGLGLGAGQALAAGPYDQPVSFDLTFSLGLDDDLAEQDIFVEQVPGSGQVYRPSVGKHDLGLPLYATAEPVAHRPFQPEDLGPWNKGKPIGVTLGEWLEAGGEGTYGCRDGKGTLDVSFTKLVPNGVYTLWYAFLAWPPSGPFVGGTHEQPVGARDGSQAVFTADAQGNAIVERSFVPCLPLAGYLEAAQLAVIYHSDGKTDGSQPARFASDCHVHLYVNLPKRSGV